jgi:5-methyltetrahydrofolate--homocysteine methyltransferase
MTDERLEKIKNAVVDMDIDGAESLTREGLDNGLSPMDVLNKSLIPAMETVGDLYGQGELFLPEMMAAVDAYNRCFPFIEPALSGGDFEPRGTVLLGTVAGDVHDIGKNILAALLQGNGYRVIDLGINVAAATFLEKAKELQPDVIGLSALLSTTMPEMKKVVELFEQSGERDKYRIIIGGAPVTREFAESIKADGYGDEAQTGVELIRQMLA